MNEIVWGSSAHGLNEAFAAWAGLQIWGTDPHQSFGKCECMGVFRSGRLIAVMVYHNWDPEAGVIEYSGAAIDPRWLSPAVLRRMFSYPFEDVGCQLLVTRNSEHNTRLHRQLKSYGFKPHFIPRLSGRDEGQFVWTLTVEDWASGKFRGGKYGKERRKCAEADAAA